MSSPDVLSFNDLPLSYKFSKQKDLNSIDFITFKNVPIIYQEDKLSKKVENFEYKSSYNYNNIEPFILDKELSSSKLLLLPNNNEKSSDIAYNNIPSFINDKKLMPEKPLLTFEKNQKVCFNNIDINLDIPFEFNEFNYYKPFVKTSDFTINDLQCYFVVNNNTTTKVTLPSASERPSYWNRKEIIIKNIYNHPILSTSNNIQQLNSTEISNCILPANNAGKYVSLMTNGKFWYINSIYLL